MSDHDLTPALGAASPPGAAPPRIVNHPGIYHQSRDGAAILMAVIHATAGTNSLGWLTSSPSNTGRVSAHALITKRGEVYIIVSDDRAANHCGFSRVTIGGTTYTGSTRPNINQVSLGVELENRNDGTDPYPDAQIAALGWLLADWQHRHGELPLYFHRDIDTKGKSDPAGLSWARVRAAMAAWASPSAELPTPLPIIGVRPSIARGTFTAVLRDHGAPFGEHHDVICARIYDLCDWLDIDPAGWAALWLHEQLVGGVLGASPIGQATRNPLNTKAYDPRALADGQLPRWPRALINGVWWNGYESWQLGCMHAVMHLKQIYGATGRLHVETILPAFAPADDQNNVPAYVAAVRRDMAAMRAREAA